MSELKKWRVTGPDGFDVIVELTPNLDDYDALTRARMDASLSPHLVMRQAGYRAEPIEEPKMVTVRAEDVETVLLFDSGPRLRAAEDRLRDALESAK